MEEKLQNLTMGQTVFIALAIMGLFWLIVYDDGSSLETRIKSVRSDIKNKQTELKKIEKAVEDAERFKVVAAQLGEQMAKVTEAIPAKLNVVDLMKLLSSEAKIVGANILGVQESSSGGSRSQNEDDDRVFEAVSVAVQLECTFTQMMMYLSNLTRVNRIITLDQIRLTTKGDPEPGQTPMLGLDAVISGYKYLEKKGPGS